MGGLEYRNKGGDNYNCAYATPVNFHVFMKYVAPTKFTHKSAYCSNVFSEVKGNSEKRKMQLLKAQNKDN